VINPGHSNNYQQIGIGIGIGIGVLLCSLFLLMAKIIPVWLKRLFVIDLYNDLMANIRILWLDRQQNRTSAYSFAWYRYC
jgi:hypothetical protein